MEKITKILYVLFPIPLAWGFVAASIISSFISSDLHIMPFVILSWMAFAVNGLRSYKEKESMIEDYEAHIMCLKEEIATMKDDKAK